MREAVTKAMVIAAIVMAGLRTASGGDLASVLKSLHLVPYRAGMNPPDFSSRTAAGQTVSLAALRGRVVVVNFWASWCLECRREMPAFERLHHDFAERGLAVVAVNTREADREVGRYAKEFHLSFPLVLDSAGDINRAYGVIGLPTTFLVGRDGRAVALAVGPRDWSGAAAKKLIAMLLAE
jgi:cytochrome c biogenesis protein CcmG, thiol:disulfide interchange protein DsbE